VSRPRDEATSLRRFALHKPSLRNIPGLLAKTYKGLLLYFGAIEGSWRGKSVEGRVMSRKVVKCQVSGFRCQSGVISKRLSVIS
jgi:hypothetical protein